MPLHEDLFSYALSAQGLSSRPKSPGLPAARSGILEKTAAQSTASDFEQTPADIVDPRHVGGSPRIGYPGQGWPRAEEGQCFRGCPCVRAETPECNKRRMTASAHRMDGAAAEASSNGLLNTHACSNERKFSEAEAASVLAEAPNGNSGSRDLCPRAVLGVGLLDEWWSHWYSKPLEWGSAGNVLGILAPKASRRLSLRHGVAAGAIAKYVKRLGKVMVQRIRTGHGHGKGVSPTIELQECYRVLRVLGSGHYGIVTVCQDIATGETFACKTITMSSVTSEELAHEVCTEVLVMLKLRGAQCSGHKNIVQIHELLVDEKSVHIIMDHCDGGDLFDFVTARRRLTQQQAAHVVKQSVDGLMHMHSVRVLHRDLKPENILLSRCGESRLPEVKLADFGLSADLEGARRTVGLAGTLHYMAPEVIRQEHYGEKVDVWSLGIILYICLSGHEPFRGRDETAVCKAVLTEKLQLVGATWEDVSSDAKDLLRQMLERNPSRRISLPAILMHPWLQSYHLESKQ